MKTNHTPGPWRDDCFNIIADGPDGYPMHLTGPCELKRNKPDEFAKNLALMAAAPELLHAAMNVVWKLSHNHLQADGTTKPGKIDRNDAVVRLCMEAIAKAEGE